MNAHLRTGFLLATWAVSTLPGAIASTVVYRATGELAASGEDVFLLDGASLEIIVFSDTAAPPASVESAAGSQLARYQPTASAVTFSGRPAMEPDLHLEDAYDLELTNGFGDSAPPDSIQLLGHQAIIGPQFGMLPSVWADFDQEFFPGNGVPAPAVFEEIEVVSVGWSGLHDLNGGQYTYSLENVRFDSVPEPAATALIAFAAGTLIGLGRRRRGRPPGTAG